MSKEKETPKEVEREAKPTIEFRTDPKEVERSQTAERNRVSEIYRLANAHNVGEDVVRDFIDNGKPLSDFQGHVLTEHLGAKKVDTANRELGLSDKEKESYSIVRALHQQATGNFDGLEAECSREMSKTLNREAKGFFLPTDIVEHQNEQVTRQLTRELQLNRALNATTDADGGYTVGTEVLGGSLVELLRNKQVLSMLGARTISGIRGDIAIPTVEGGATAYWLTETAEVTGSQQTFGQIAMTPKRLVGDTAYSKQLLAQSSISVEAFVRDDLMTVLALAKDLAGINGSGASGQPTGILNTTGIGSVTFGAAATRAKAIEFQTDVAASNASTGSLSYLTDPTVAGAWMGIEEASGTAQWLWKGNVDEGNVVGRRAVASNQVPGNKVIYGNFNDAVFADWDGFDVVVDPYSLKKQGLIEVTVQLLTDFAVRHASSFSASADAGNQ